MKVILDIGHGRSVNRHASVIIGHREFADAVLSVSAAAERNRTGGYMRRHVKQSDLTRGIAVGPNSPLRSPSEPAKISIAEHFRQIYKHRQPEFDSPEVAQADTFFVQPVQLIIPVSDVVANLMRPCYSKEGFGRWRTFFLEDEPIDQRSYWSACFFRSPDGVCEIQFIDLRFDVANDEVFSLDGRCLSRGDLQWSVSLVPLVKHSIPVEAREIATSDYDLRQLFGRHAEADIQWAYEGWYDSWEQRVSELVDNHLRRGTDFEVFYHSILAVDRDGAIHIRQVDGSLPQLAQELAAEGMVSAGLLDSGGSSALYDPWLQGYLNHGWYFREPRGAVICLQLRALERIPKDLAGSWFKPRRDTTGSTDI